VLAAVSEERVNASLAVILEKLSKVEAFSEQGLGVLDEVRGDLAAHGDGLAADWKEALANVSWSFQSSWWEFFEECKQRGRVFGISFPSWKSEVLRRASEDALKDCKLEIVV
jgi:hypothetical protein